MPKKQKKDKEERYKEIGEGRPPELTLASFIKPARSKPKPSAKQEHAKDGILGPDEDEAGTKSTTERQKPINNTDESRNKNETRVSEGACCGGVDNLTQKQGHKRCDDVIGSPDDGGAGKIPFRITRTKKGGYPILVEKRASGKKVTILRQVTGNLGLLLQQLKTKFGTGGLIKGDQVEIQGDFEAKLTKYLQENNKYMKPYAKEG
eukprot:gene6190-6905_t